MLLFLDGQAHYDSARLALKYSSVSTDFCTWSVTAEGRFGNCIKRVSTGNQANAGYLSMSPLMTRLGPWTPTASGVCGFAIKVDDLSRIYSSAGSPTAPLFVIAEGSGYHVYLNLNVNGTISLYRYEFGGGGEPVVLAQSTEGLTNATWAFVEVKWVIHASAGSVEVRINGVPILTYSGNTRENYLPFVSLGIWNAIHLGTAASNPSAPFLTMRFCDIYLADLVAPAADDVHDFLGDGTILTIMPNAPGAATGWTPSAAPNWDCVNDRPAPDDDASYVATAGPGISDLYQFEDIPSGALVKGAQLSILARKETEGGAALAPLIQPPGSAALQGPTQGIASTAYTSYLTQPYDLNPATGVRFTANDINAGQFGQQKVV